MRISAWNFFYFFDILLGYAVDDSFWLNDQKKKSNVMLIKLSTWMA
jgi:hypothetical protein